MITCQKILNLFLLLVAFSFHSFAQNIDSLKSSKTNEQSGLSPATDSITGKKSSSVSDIKFLPDTVYLKNGDKLTGYILVYEQGRLKIDAQGTGIVFIKSQKILSVCGGDQQFKLENSRKEIYTGNILCSNDTNKIIIKGESTYEFLFPDIFRILPMKGLMDTLMPVKTNEEEVVKQPENNHSADTVFLKNGDKITGNILSFEQGRLKVDAQGPGDVSIKWYKIVSINGGSRIFKIEDQKGVIYIGYILFSKDTGEIILANTRKYELLLADIVRIFPLEEKWYRGFKGNLGAGVSYAKSSDVLTINADYNLYYVVSKWRFINDFSYISTKTDDEPTSVRIQADFQALYALPDKWVLSEINSFNRNDELGIKSRISFGAGGGNNLIQTERQRLLALTGILHNSEKLIDSSQFHSNFEWPITLQHVVYSFINPNLSTSTDISSYVGITEKGRYRFDANTNITWEFINNVKLQLTYYYNYDNKVVEGKTSQKDYGTVLSLLVDLK